MLFSHHLDSSSSVIFSALKRYLTTLAGLPTTSENGFTSFVTTAPAPIKENSPILIPQIIEIDKQNRVGKYGRLIGRIILVGLDVGKESMAMGFSKPFGSKN